MFTSTGSSGLCEYWLPPSWCPLGATLRTLRRRLEATGARGVAGGLRADYPGVRTFWWFQLVGGSGHRPHLSRGAGVANGG